MERERGLQMKRVVSSGLVTVVLLVLPMTLWANEFTRYWVSNEEDTKVFYYESGNNSKSVAPTEGLPDGWNSDPYFDDTEYNDWFAAYLIAPEFVPSDYLDPTSETSPFDNTGAQWISIRETGEGEDFDRTDGTRGVYLYRQIFQVPAVAYNLSGKVAIASDNYGWLYLNGVKVLGGDLSGNGENYLAPSTDTIPRMQLACDNVLAAEIQNGCQNCGEHGPTATIFALKLDYELPDVEWQPPVTNSGIRKNGSTLPLKFRLYTQDGKLIKKVQYVTLAVHEGKLTEQPGPVVKDWTLGNSVQHLRFSKGNGQYIANFQTQKMDDLDDGTYTAVVHDGCTDEVLGYIEFDLVGKKKEKDPKPPKPKK
jgi:hypothetical protein